MIGGSIPLKEPSGLGFPPEELTSGLEDEHVAFCGDALDSPPVPVLELPSMSSSSNEVVE